MDEEFSPSLTPPVSPFAVDSQCDSVLAPPPCFSCLSQPVRDESGLLAPDGYVAKGALKRLLLKLDPAPADYETDMVDLFGFSWVTETAMVESTTLLFNLFRQAFLRLENLALSGTHDFGQAYSHHSQAEQLRQHCVRFLQYVRVFISRYMLPPRDLEDTASHPYVALEAQLPSVLLEQLFGLTLLVDRLKNLPSNLQACLAMQHQGTRLPPAWHLLHLHMDVHWSVLEILHLLEERMMGQVVYAQQLVDLTGENFTNVSLFEKQVTSLLLDLIGLAMTQYSKVRPTEALAIPPYHCICTKELWVLLVHLLDHRSRTLHTQSFWSYLNKLLWSVLKGEPQDRLVDGLAPCKDPLGFTWWLLTHLAELGQTCSNGTHQDEKLKENWSFVAALLKSSLGSQGLEEEQLRLVLHCCLSLCLLWEPSVSVVTALWEHFSKNLNSAFTVPWLGVSGLGSVSRTPLSLLELARSCCASGPPDPAQLRSASHVQLYRSSNSFHMFLRILAVYLSKGTGDGAPWRQIKGRIYSKFHQRRMMELSERGLMHFLLLFLVLGRQAELEDACGRAGELLELRPSSSLSIAQQALLWRGQLAFVLLFQERGLDVAALAERVGGAFAQAARDFYLKTTEAARKLALWPLLGSYMEGVQEVMESGRHLHLSEERLLNQGFGLLLPACRQSELGSALGFLQAALAQLRRVQQHSAQAPPPSVAKECHLAVAAALWANFFPFLRNLRLSQTPPAQLADCAAGFCLLALDLPSSAPQDLQPQPALSMMTTFAWDEMLHPLVVTRYLTHLLHDSTLVSSMTAASGSAQALCIRAWIRCVLQQHVHKGVDGSESRADKMLRDQLNELTRLVFRLPEVESLLQEAVEVQPSARQEPGAAVAVFIKVVGGAYRRLQNLAERSHLVTRALDYIGDVLKHVKPYLANRSPPEGLQLAYRTVGCLVKQWSPLLATSKAQQLLFRIVDVLLLPHALFQQDKNLPAAMLSAVRDSLPLYLQGLSEAAGTSQTQGAYLRQQLRSVIAHYLERFFPATPAAAALAEHPILLAVRDAPPGHKGAVLSQTVLQVLSNHIVQCRGPASYSKLAMMLAFLFEMLKRTRHLERPLLALPLPAVLHCLLLVSESQVRKLSTDVLQLLFELHASDTPDGSCDQVSAVLKSFVEENVDTYDQQVYGVLELVALLDRVAVETLIPVLTLRLRSTEHKRGLGRNATLRNTYKKLLSSLGERGIAEMASLDRD
uniref:Protein MMS22-like n=1 Tax=Paramormyrops kingsleyae TaxID=1676925 RepID=A0A3B3QZJ3_9TELE|nr:protein MMS22-like [Paramormyrops kingsleyae]